MTEKNKNVFVSFSSASRFKTCPTKYYLSKKYKSKLTPSALPLGKAIEVGVVKLLLGETLEIALEAFEKLWTDEEVSPGQTRPIFDNSEVEFYASDFDKNLIFGEAQQVVEDWSTELLGDNDENWQETFESIALRLKNQNDGVNPAELQFHNRVIWLCCLIRGQTMLEAFQRKELANFKVYVQKDGKPAVQKEITMENAEGDKVIGFIDFILYHKDYKEPITTDLKTAAYPYPQHALETSEQLRTYVAAVGEEIESTRAGYLVLIKKIRVERSCDNCGADREGMAKNCKSCKKGQYTVPKLDADIQFITKNYAQEEVEDLLEDYMNVTVAIKNEVNFKNPSNCNQYNRKCEFYDICWKRKSVEQVSHLEEKKPLTVVVESDTNEN